jgi:hypothetical protein
MTESNDAIGDIRDIIRLGARLQVRRLIPGYRLALLKDPAQLPLSCRERLFELFRKLSHDSFDADMTRYWQAHEADHLTQLTSLALIVTDPGAVVGMSCYGSTRLQRGSAMFIGSTMVRRNHQKRGLASQAVGSQVREHLRTLPRLPLYVATRTANPVVYRGMRRVAGSANHYPALEAAPPVAIRRAAEQIAHWQGFGHAFDSESMVVTGAYAMLPTVYQVRPSSPEPEVDAYFDRLLGPEDAFLVVARVTPVNLVLGLSKVFLKKVGKAVRPSYASP